MPLITHVPAITHVLAITHMLIYHTHAYLSHTCPTSYQRFQAKRVASAHSNARSLQMYPHTCPTSNTRWRAQEPLIPSR